MATGETQTAGSADGGGPHADEERPSGSSTYFRKVSLSCSSMSAPRMERTKPRSGRSAETETPAPCAGLLVRVLTLDGNSAIAASSPPGGRSCSRRRPSRGGHRLLRGSFRGTRLQPPLPKGSERRDPEAARCCRGPSPALDAGPSPLTLDSPLAAPA